MRSSLSPEVSLDKLDILRETERLGGPERRQALTRILVETRNLGCKHSVSDARVGGINIRFGTLGFAVADFQCDGTVKVYAKPHSSLETPEEMHEALNEFVKEAEGMETKSHPIGTYGHLDDPLEEVPLDSILGFIRTSVSAIRAQWYSQRPDQMLFGTV